MPKKLFKIDRWKQFLFGILILVNVKNIFLTLKNIAKNGVITCEKATV